MFRTYGITGASNPSGWLDAVMQRLAQARRIKRFCETKGLELDGNSIVTNDMIYELNTAYNLFEWGWIDYVIITSMEVFSNSEDEKMMGIINYLINHNALIVIDEFRLFLV